MADEPRKKHSQMSADDRSVRSLSEVIAGKFGELLESMPDGIIITDASGKIVLVP